MPIARHARLALALLCLAFPAGPAAAQVTLLAQYVADLGPEDRVNSRGTRLTTFAALLAQDRANYHRFGIRHRHDGADPIFGNRAMRAQIGPGVLDVPDYYRQYVANVLSSDGAGGTYLVVYVFGTGSRITRIGIEVPG